MGKTSYAIALGSNRRHGRHGGPAAVLVAAVEAIESRGTLIEAVSLIRTTRALGPAGRSFANAAMIVSTELNPQELLGVLKDIERAFGRRRGRRWGPRVLDLDIILWSGGIWAGAGITIPHPGYRTRRFVLDPLVEVAPEWRDPLSGLSVRQLLHRFARRTPVDPAGSRS